MKKFKVGDFVWHKWRRDYLFIVGDVTPGGHYPALVLKDLPACATPRGTIFDAIAQSCVPADREPTEEECVLLAKTLLLA